MKLYICLTTYHLLSACTLALLDKNNASELLVESFTDEETDIVKAIRESGIFKKVYYINQSDAWMEINKLDKASSAIEIHESAKSAVRFWRVHFKYFNNITKRYSDINIMDDHFTLGMALAYLKIPYHYYEDSPGCHYRRDVFIKLSEEEITNKAYSPIAKQFGLRGDYQYAQSFNYDFSLNPMKHGEKDKDFSLITELIHMKVSKAKDFETIKKVFASNGYFLDYCKEKNKEGRGNFLLIGQHYSDFTYKNTNIIKYMLSLVVDYFGMNMNLWIKNHPSNYFNPMQSWFPDANYIVDKIPLELLAAEGVLHFDRVAAISSSAPLVMHRLNSEVILFQNIEDGDSFESKKRFLDLHKYFVVAKLIERIGSNYTINSFYTYGTEPLSLDYLIKYQSIQVPAVKPIREIRKLKEIKIDINGIICYFIDRVEDQYKDERSLKNDISDWLLSCSENDVIFFVNSDKKNIFFNAENYEVMEYLYPLPLDLVDLDGNSGLFGYGDPEYPLKHTIEKLHRESYGNYSKVERQMIFMYTKNTEISKLALSYSLEKNMQHCGINLIYNPASMNYRELLFESMLEQLEKQYVDLQAENEQLEEQCICLRATNEQLRNQLSIMSGDDTVMQSIFSLGHETVSDDVIISINASSTMLMNRLTEIDERLIRFLSWYGFKKRIKEKWETIFKSKH